MPRDSAAEPYVAPMELLPATVDQELLRLSGLLDSVTKALARETQAAASAQGAWKRAEAHSLLRSERKSEDLRRAEALDANKDLYLEALTVEARRDALQERSRSLRTQIEALRTLCANLRGLS